MPMEEQPDAHEPEQQPEEVSFEQQGPGHNEEGEHSDHGTPTGHHQHQMTTLSSSHLPEPAEEPSQCPHLLVTKATEEMRSKDDLQCTTSALETDEWETRLLDHLGDEQPARALPAGDA